MSKKIETKELLVMDLFDKRWYTIPEYQRPYVWEKDQVTELLNDTYEAYESDPDKKHPKSQYFLGSLVLQKAKDSLQSEFDVLDGQQRLTTLFLTHAVIRDIIPRETKEQIQIHGACKAIVYQEAFPAYNIPERIRIQFNTRKEVRNFVDKFVKTENGTQNHKQLEERANDKDEDISIRNMANAILVMNEFFSRPIISENLVGFFGYLSTNVLMIYVATEELHDAFRLFTVMNNRGIKLRNSDILKAKNLAKVDENKRKTYAEQWEEVERFFRDSFDNFLSHLRTILVKQKAKQSLLKEFEENIYPKEAYDQHNEKLNIRPGLLQEGESTFDFVDKYFKHYLSLFDRDNFDVEDGFRLYNQLTMMQEAFKADFWIAPLLRYYDKYHDDGITTFLRLLEVKFASDWILSLTPAKRIENVNSIIRLIEATNDTKSLFGSDVFSIVDEEALKKALTGSVYDKRYVKYLLLRTELMCHGDTSRLIIPKTVTIEHILPQSPNETSQWYVDFSEEEREKWTDRLGNLILISRRKNSSMKNYDYKDKMEAYFSKNVEREYSYSQKVMRDNKEKWTLVELKNNHRKVLGDLCNFFGIDLSDDEWKEAMQ